MLWIAFGIPLVALFAILHGAGMPKDWWLIIEIAVSAAGFYILYTLALYRMDVSVMAPLFSLRMVFAVLLPYSSNIELINGRLTPVLSVMTRMALDASVAVLEQHPDAQLVMLGERVIPAFRRLPISWKQGRHNCYKDARSREGWSHWLSLRGDLSTTRRFKCLDWPNPYVVVRKGSRLR